MIKKKFRLKERDVKRVLQKGEPFFSYGIVLNKQRNKLNLNRFSIVISGKSVSSGVERNFFRRRFYDFVKESKIFSEKGFDLVFVVKNKVKLLKKESSSLDNFLKDLKFLVNKIG